MPALDCGIDVGSTNVKVVLVGEDGRAVYVKAVASPRVSDGVGPVTDALALIHVLEDLIIEGWKIVGAGTPLRSITAAGVGEDGVGVRRDLTPTGHALPWFDKRASEEAKILEGYARFVECTGNVLTEDRTAAKWLWLYHHRPQELVDATCWITLTDFPAVWWSGRPFMSNSLAPRTSCYDIFNRQWIDELLTATHAPELPPILGAGSVVGGVRKGKLRDSGAASSETLVVAGGHDHPVAATMIRRFDPSGRVDSMGTANLIYGETTNVVAQKMGGLLSYSLPPTGNSGIGCLGVVELGVAIASLQEDAAYFKNYLAAHRLPGSPPLSRADLTELKTDRDLFIRRGLESASLEARRMFDAMDEIGVERGAIYATGGWSRSRGFVELRASIFGEAIHVIEDMELVGVGAALFGAEAASGKAVCPFSREDISTVEPVTAWLDGYQRIYAEMKMASG
jgi:xylulokinase